MKSSSHSECPLLATHSPFFGRHSSTCDRGVEIAIQKLSDSEVHVQRTPDPDGEGMLYGAVEELQQTVSEHDESIDQIETRQQQVMGTLLEASPGAPDDFDWEGAAVRGATGASVGFSIGALTGSPEAAGVSALLAGGGAVAKDVSKELVGTLMTNRPGGEADQLGEMYLEMARMYEEMLDAKDDTGGAENQAASGGDV